ARRGDRIAARRRASYARAARGRGSVVRGHRQGAADSEGNRDEPTPLRAPPGPRGADRERRCRGSAEAAPTPRRRGRMSPSTRSEIPDRMAYLLNAYRDGELSRFTRWRFERRLRHSPDLQRALAELERVGDWVRASEAESPGADLWDAIALRL